MTKNNKNTSMLALVLVKPFAFVMRLMTIIIDQICMIWSVIMYLRSVFVPEKHRVQHTTLKPNTIPMQHSAFTLVELSVVIVILSILIATVLVSRTLIMGAKINKIQEEVRMFQNVVTSFNDTYNCLPGDCTNVQVSTLVTAGLSSLCTNTATATANVPAIYLSPETFTTGSATLLLNNGMIDNDVKRTCMMHSLQLAGYITGVDPTYNNATQINDVIAGKNIPYAKFSSTGAWDFRYVVNNSNNINRGNTPMQVGHTRFPLTAQYVGQHMLVLRNAQLVSGVGSLTGAWDSHAQFQNNSFTNVLNVISANMMNKLDTKFDDGISCGGNIVGTKVDAVNTTICDNTIGNAGPYYSSTYISSNDISKGCLGIFLITTSQ